jgi:uncharacterized protein
LSFVATDDLIVTDFVCMEFASAVGRKRRTGQISVDEATLAFATLDDFVARFARRIEVQASDLRCAERFLRAMTTPLKAPDALHLAVAQRIYATLATFDVQLARAAQASGVPVTPLP